MKHLPPRPDPGQLKKQAKELLAALRAGGGATHLRLHDAQLRIAREHGFASWPELAGFVELRRAQADDPARGLQRWLSLVYAGDIAGGMNRARPALAARWLAEHPQLAAGDPWLACAVGDGAAVRRAIAQDATWVNRPGGPLQLPPLVALTHSSLLQLPAHRTALHDCARALLAAGADPNASVGNRWPPASVQAPSATERLSALYGAAGQNHDEALTRLLLQAGANPNDGESLYHSLEGPGCTALLLAAGARVTGSNALYHVLDHDDLPRLELLLAHGGDPNEPGPGEWPRPLLWAIRRRRSPAHITALLAAGADPGARTAQGADGADAATLARRLGLTGLAALLGGPDPSTQAVAEQFAAACARGDEAAARALQARHPELAPAQLASTLPAPLLRLLPELAAQGCHEAVHCMVRLGWPVATRGGDWDASALNQAVFRGDAPLARWLLEHGAQWTEQHGFGDNACGTLSWASLNTPDVDGGQSDDSATPDWPGCAQALLDHGMPAAQPDPQDADGVLIGGRRSRFSDEVTQVLLQAPAPLP